MIEPSTVQLNLKKRNQGLYESFYFRGNSEDGKWGFWLKHNLFRFHHDRYVIVSNHFILFNRDSCQTDIYHVEEKLTDYEYLNYPGFQAKNWDDCSFEFSEGSYFKITKDKLSGQIIQDGKSLSWKLHLDRSDMTYYHFPQKWFYKGFFPKKKILTRDCFLGFKGTIKSSGDETIETSFMGMNGHNWGKEHAHQYFYANCNQFHQDKNIYFDGFSAKLALLRGKVKTPYLSGCSLYMKGKWYHFNEVYASMNHDVNSNHNHHWEVSFVNKDHQLNVCVYGGPSEMPWAKLDYDHPDHKVSHIGNTKFAKGELELMERKSGTHLALLTSKHFELETCFPT